MSKVALYHYGGYELPLLNINHSLITDYDSRLDDFLADTCKTKLAIVEINYSAPELSAVELEKLQHCTCVIVMSMEIESRIIDVIEQFDLPNFIFVINGFLNYSLKHARADQEQYWMNSTSYPYQFEWVDYINHNLHAFDKKPYMFDVLYGKHKTHREFVKQQIANAEEKDCFFETPFFLFGNENRNFENLNFDQADLWEDGMEISQEWNYHCCYRGKEMRISQVLPLKIYNRTAYTVVLETWADNRYSFFTEKIVKPIVACRLFVVISGQYYLRNLRRLGFQTFGNILDESYDDIEDDHTRWQAAIDQARWLCHQPQEEILSKIAPIVLHNYKVMSNLNYSKVNQCAETFLIQHTCYNSQDII